jgi:tetratricopeptide (TPR) repeat protein
MARLSLQLIFIFTALQMTACSMLSTKSTEEAAESPARSDQVESPEDTSHELQDNVLTPFDESSSGGMASAKLKPLKTPTDIPPGMLYQLMVAEIAYQRGQLDVALANYLDVAKESKDPEVAERATQLAVYAQDMGAALTASALWVELDDANPDAHRTYAAVLLRIGRAADAVEEYEKMIALLPAGKIARAYNSIVSQLSREPNHALALSVMEKLMESRMDDPQALFSYAHLAMRHGKFDVAMDTLDKLLALKPTLGKAVILRARILAMQGGRDQALDYLAGAVKKGSLAKNIEVGLTYARMLTEAKKFELALQQFIRLTKLNPKNEELHYFAGILALQLRKADVAAEHLETVLKIGRQRIYEANYYLGQVAELNKDQKKAIEYYSSVRRGEMYFNAQIRVVALLAEEKQFKQARDHLKTIRATDEKEQMQLYLLEGDILREAKRYDEAKSFYTGVLDRYPDQTSIRYARALIAEKLGELDLVESDLLSILKVEPDNAQVLNALGYTLADRTKRYDEALQYIQKAMELEPNDAAVMDSMGWVKYRLGDFEAAVAHLRKANDLAKDPEIAAHLGEVLWVMGKKNDALKVWEDALKKDPNHAILLKVMKKFGL